MAARRPAGPHNRYDYYRLPVISLPTVTTFFVIGNTTIHPADISEARLTKAGGAYLPRRLRRHENVDRDPGEWRAEMAYLDAYLSGRCEPETDFRLDIDRGRSHRCSCRQPEAGVRGELGLLRTDHCIRPAIAWQRPGIGMQYRCHDKEVWIREYAELHMVRSG